MKTKLILLFAFISFALSASAQKANYKEVDVTEKQYLPFKSPTWTPKRSGAITVSPVNGIAYLYYNGEWIPLGGSSGGGVTTFAGRNGVVTPVESDYLPFFLPRTLLSTDGSLAVGSTSGAYALPQGANETFLGSRAGLLGYYAPRTIENTDFSIAGARTFSTSSTFHLGAVGGVRIGGNWDGNPLTFNSTATRLWLHAGGYTLGSGTFGNIIGQSTALNISHGTSVTLSSENIDLRPTNQATGALGLRIQGGYFQVAKVYSTLANLQSPAPVSNAHALIRYSNYGNTYLLTYQLDQDRALRIFPHPFELGTRFLIINKNNNSFKWYIDSEDYAIKYLHNDSTISELQNNTAYELVFGASGTFYIINQSVVSGSGGGSGGPETDPTVEAWIKAITSAQITNWNNAYSWGNHASAGYLNGSGSYSNPTWLTDLPWSKITGAPTFLTGETDPEVGAHIKSITTTEKGNWNTAFGWGNHASAGYLNSSGTYLNPTWLTGLAWSKITGAPSFLTAETDPSVASHVKSITTTEKTNWNTAFGWGNHASAGYLTTEADPTIGAHIKSITTTEKTNWNTAFGWGNHASAGYLSSSGSYSNPTWLTGLAWSKISGAPAFLTSETDPSVASHVKSITTTEKTNWNTAFGWGNHASAGYLSSSGSYSNPTWLTGLAWSKISGAPSFIVVMGTPTDGQIIKRVAGANQWVNVDTPTIALGWVPGTTRNLFLNPSKDSITDAGWKNSSMIAFTKNNDSSNTATLIDGSITAAKLAPGVIPSTTGGDLVGSLPNPIVKGLRGVNISSTAPTTGQVLKFNGTDWAPAAESGGGGGADKLTMGGDAIGSAISVGTNDNFSFSLRSNNNVRMTVRDNGNIGIGTSTPTAKLQMGDNSGNSGGDFYSWNNAADPRFLFGQNSNASFWGGLYWNRSSKTLRILNSGYHATDGAIAIDSFGRVGIKIGSNMTASLQVAPDPTTGMSFLTRAAGSSATVYPVRVENTAGDINFAVAENGRLLWGGSVNNELTSNGLKFNSLPTFRFHNFGTSTGTFFSFQGNSNIAPTTGGDNTIIAATATITPSSGSVAFNGIADLRTINQTGTASGRTRSFYANPTLTAAPDYVAFEAAAGKSALKGMQYGVRNVSSSTTVTDNDYTIVTNHSANDVVITLPPVATNAGRYLVIIPTVYPPTSTGFRTRIDGNGSEQIETALTRSTDTGGAITIVCDGTRWHFASARWTID